jgi:hypothetical protein
MRLVYVYNRHSKYLNTCSCSWTSFLSCWLLYRTERSPATGNVFVSVTIFFTNKDRKFHKQRRPLSQFCHYISSTTHLLIAVHLNTAISNRLRRLMTSQAIVFTYIGYWYCSMQALERILDLQQQALNIFCNYPKMYFTIFNSLS